MNLLNTKRLIFIGCFALVVFSASLALAGGRGHSSSARSIASRPAVVQSASRFTPTVRNSTARVQRWNGNWNNTNRNLNRRTSWNRWDGNGRHCGRRTRVVFVGSFGFPWYYSSPYYYDYYPYSYYPSNYYPYGSYYQGDATYGDDGAYNDDSAYYGSRYGRDLTANGSTVAQVQRTLAREGYYKGAIDGEMGPRTYYAIRSYQRSHNLAVDGAITSRLLGRMGLR
jgi:putative peptidoglycan binding protein